MALGTGCQQTKDGNVENEEKIVTIAQGINIERSIITWILEGDELVNGAVKIDSGSLLHLADMTPARVGMVSKDMIFESADSIGYNMEVRLSDIVLFDSAGLDTASLSRDFVLDNPSHLAVIQLVIEDSTTRSGIPIRIRGNGETFEVEGKVSLESTELLPSSPLQQLHIGFLVHTDKTE